MLNAEAEHRRSRRFVSSRETCQAGSKDGKSRRAYNRSIFPTYAGRAEVCIAELQIGVPRFIGVCVVDVVSLNALIEHAKAAPQNRLAGSEQILGESDAGLK